MSPLREASFLRAFRACPVSHLCVVPHTLAKSVAPVVEVIIHALPMKVHPTGGTGLWPGVVLSLCSQVALLSVDHLCDQPHLPADVFRSLDHDEDLGGDDLAPLEHCLVSRPSSSPHLSLGEVRVPSGKCLVAHAPQPQAPPLSKCMCLVPCTTGLIRQCSSHHGTHVDFGCPCFGGR